MMRKEAHNQVFVPTTAQQQAGYAHLQQVNQSYYHNQSNPANHNTNNSQGQGQGQGQGPSHGYQTRGATAGHGASAQSPMYSTATPAGAATRW